MKRGCRKRCRRSPSGGADSAHGGVGGSNQTEVARDSEVESDLGSSRCSAHLIHEVVSKFDSQKIRLVEETGFEGILNFPPIKQFNRRFSLWLMTSVIPESRTLKIGEEICLKFSKNDVAHVFGIPCNGKAVVDCRFSAREAKDRVVDRFLGSRFKENRSIKLVQEIIEREYPDTMSQSEADTFKVAFVVFVVSILLAPSAKHDYASIDYWNAISDPGLLQTFDWSDFVILKLVEGVSKLKDDIACNIKFPNITGCSLFLQVLYLDSLNLESHLMRHNTFPRIRDFTHEKLRLMIQDDRNFLRHARGVDDVPEVKLRDPLGCVYSWAASFLGVRGESRGCSMMAIWEAVVCMVNLLDIPFEAAGPVFVAAADFQEQVNSGMFVTGTQALKFVSVLMSLMLPYRRGFSYQHRQACGAGSELVEGVLRNGMNLLAEPVYLQSRVQCETACGKCSNSSNSLGQRRARNGPEDIEMSLEAADTHSLQSTEIGDHVCRSWNSLLSSVEHMPDYLNLDARVATAMSQFYCAVRRPKPCRGFDLNSCGCQANCVSDGSTSSSSSSGPVLPSPWEIGYCWLSCDSDLSEFREQIPLLSEYEGMVIVHRVPKYIQISGSELHGQLVGNREMEMDLFDVLVRRARQVDDELYVAYGEYRWRFIFESDFMACVLSGSLALNDCGVRERLISGSSRYDLSKCKIMFFPALLYCSWVCFAWALDENVIYVFEPSQLSAVDERRVTVIERACYVLKIALDTIRRVMCIDGLQHPQNASVRLLTLPDIGRARLNRSGALCYMFCCCFDGSDMVPRFTVHVNDALPGKLLQCGIQLKENTGKFPNSCPHSLN